MYYQLWRHASSGEVWAVELDESDAPQRARGPLSLRNAEGVAGTLQLIDYNTDDDQPMQEPDAFKLHIPTGWVWDTTEREYIRPTDIVRDQVIRLRVSQQEKEAITRSAEESGQTISEYIRSKVVMREVPVFNLTADGKIVYDETR